MATTAAPRRSASTKNAATGSQGRVTGRHAAEPRPAASRTRCSRSGSSGSSTTSARSSRARTRSIRLALIGLPRQRSRAVRGHAGHGQDDARPRDRPDDQRQAVADPVHARPAAGRHHRLARARPQDRRLRLPRRARSSPTSSSPTRSTGPRRRRSRRCSRRWPSGGSPSTASRTTSRTRSSCWPRRTRSRRRARSRCPRPSSTGSCSS